MQCDMCGASGELYIALVEGSRLTVCTKCVRFGKALQKVPQKEMVHGKQKGKQIVEEVVVEHVVIIADDYADKIRNAREKAGLSQKDFAAKITEKISLVQHLETGKLKPSVDLARKLERLLHISLIEETDVKFEPGKNDTKKPGVGFTIGDMIRIR